MERAATSLSVFSPNAGKYGSEKLRIRTLFTHWLGMAPECNTLFEFCLRFLQFNNFIFACCLGTFDLKIALCLLKCVLFYSNRTHALQITTPCRSTNQYNLLKIFQVPHKNLIHHCLSNWFFILILRLRLSLNSESSDWTRESKPFTKVANVFNSLFRIDSYTLNWSKIVILSWYPFITWK